MSRIVALSTLAAALVGLIYGWYSWAVGRSDASSSWRKTASGFGLAAMTARLLLLIPIYTNLTNHFETFFDRWWFPTELALFVFALFLVAVGSHTGKWWLFASSAYFLAFCFLILLDS